MSWSIGEISALSIKAARGSGMPWGMAEEVGWSIRFLARSGLPGPQALAAHLSGARGSCPIALGTALSDTGQISLLGTAEPVSAPLLTLPFLSRMPGAAQGICVDIAGCLARVTEDRVDLRGTVSVCAAIRQAPRFDGIPRPDPAVRIEAIDGSALKILNDYAARTYAPATEASRLRGAGAGLTDND